MDDEQVLRILRQVAGGNGIFDPNSAEETDLLGYGSGTGPTEAEARLLRYHLDTLARQGAIGIVAVSTAGCYTVDITARGRERLRALGG